MREGGGWRVEGVCEGPDEGRLGCEEGGGQYLLYKNKKQDRTGWGDMTVTLLVQRYT